MSNLFFWSSRKSRPVGLKWRSSSWLITFVIGLGIAVDLLVYSIIIPVMPFQLERLGYSRVAALTGWLLFAYSAGLVVSTIPIAIFSERYNARKIPLLFGLFVLVSSQVMLMEAPNYPVMCIARILQGIGSSLVWVVGLALLCDSAPPSIVGLQLGCAMGGLSVGLVIGPPVGGALYSRFGYRAPFVFGICATMLDLIGRLIVIERKEALLWGVDPTTVIDKDANNASSNAIGEDGVQPPPQSASEEESNKESDSDAFQSGVASGSADTTLPQQPNTSVRPLPFLTVIARLAKSSRALVSLFIIFVYGIVYSSQEPSIPLHLQRIWNLDSAKVGLIFIAAVVPTLFSSPITGYLTDKNGAEWVTILSLLLALPWWVIIIIQRNLALFIAAFAIETLFTSGVISPLTAELAAVSRNMEGVGYGHVYGAFNLAYGIGTSVGPVIGGQLYDHLKHGWMALCILAAGLLAVCLLLAFAFVGRDPLLQRLLRRYQILPNPAK